MAKNSSATIVIEGSDKAAEIIAALVKQGLILDIEVNHSLEFKIEITGW